MKPIGPESAYSMEWIKRKRKVPGWVEVAGCILLFLLGFMFVGWIIITFTQWAFPFYDDGNPTLLEVLRGQWEWFQKRKIY